MKTKKIKKKNSISTKKQKKVKIQDKKKMTRDNMTQKKRK